MKDDPDRTEQFKRENRMAQMAKLRIRWESMGEMANIERALAAGTIQDLMDEVEAWQKAMQKAERDIAELRAERDEARREVCRWLAEAEGGTPEEHAADQGWACVDEDENGTMNAP